MKNSINIIIIVLCILLSVSCRDLNNDSLTISSENQASKIELIDNPLQPIQIDTVIAGDYGNYLDMFVPTDYTLAIRAVNNHTLNRKVITSVARKNKDNGHEDLSEKFLLNGMRIKSSTYTKADSDLSSVFGNHANLSISGDQRTKSDNEGHDLYVPEIINISSPAIGTDENKYPLCDFSNFVLRWNQDLKNDNGVMIMVTWGGTTIIGESYPDTYVRRIDIVPDTGEATINPHMFDDIPDTALCNILVARGNVEIFQDDDESIQLLGESHESFPFILIRNLDR